MNKFRIIPLSEAYARQIRSTMVDDIGLPVKEQLAKGYGPCRVSLQPFEVGVDERLLFSHSPFDMNNAFNQRGPVFIHKKPVKSYADIYRFPPEIKADKDHFPLTLIGYSKNQNMVYSQLVGNADVDEMINEVFTDNPKVAYLHARNAEAGCFILKIVKKD